MPDGGRCLNVYISRKGEREHLGHFGVQELRSDSRVKWFIYDVHGDRPTPLLPIGQMDPQPTKATNKKK